MNSRSEHPFDRLRTPPQTEAEAEVGVVASKWRRMEANGGERMEAKRSEAPPRGRCPASRTKGMERTKQSRGVEVEVARNEAI